MELLVSNVVLVKRWLTIVEPSGHKASIVVRIRDAEGPPLLVTKTFGSGGGEVTLLAVTADKFWSTLPSTDLFVVLSNQVHRCSARRRDVSAHNLMPDGTYRLSLDAGVYRSDVTVRAQAGEDERTFTAAEAVPPPGQPATAPGAPQARLEVTIGMSELRRLGAYEVELLRHDGVPEKRVFARNPPVVESRLVGFLDTAFTRLYPPELHPRITFVREDAGLGSGSGGEGELWRWIAAALLIGLLTESLLAWRFGRR
jgi:hypothetical protein